ncbi:hypothetical protein FG379_002487 [Cryptosporidium bovis]|uniref:uncharacterized protein n=1 Tax=Cryptosporidium bovis TaxID=310047 RepID=UPI00351A309B|nr:hypothetical protein FG379_002487 [Cryptosporidium bovis]
MNGTKINTNGGNKLTLNNQKLSNQQLLNDKVQIETNVEETIKFLIRSIITINQEVSSLHDFNVQTIQAILSSKNDSTLKDKIITSPSNIFEINNYDSNNYNKQKIICFDVNLNDKLSDLQLNPPILGSQMPDEKPIIKRIIPPNITIDLKSPENKYNLLVQKNKCKIEKERFKKLNLIQKQQINKLNQQISQLNDALNTIQKYYPTDNGIIIDDLNKEIVKNKQLIKFLEDENKILSQEANENRIEILFLIDKLKINKRLLNDLSKKLDDNGKLIDVLVTQKNLLIEKFKNQQKLIFEPSKIRKVPVWSLDYSKYGHRGRLKGGLNPTKAKKHKNNDNEKNKNPSQGTSLGSTGGNYQNPNQGDSSEGNDGNDQDPNLGSSSEGDDGNDQDPNQGSNSEGYDDNDQDPNQGDSSEGNDGNDQDINQQSTSKSDSNVKDLIKQTNTKSGGKAKDPSGRTNLKTDGKAKDPSKQANTKSGGKAKDQSKQTNPKTDGKAKDQDSNEKFTSASTASNNQDTTQNQNRKRRRSKRSRKRNHTKQNNSSNPLHASAIQTQTNNDAQTQTTNDAQTQTNNYAQTQTNIDSQTQTSTSAEDSEEGKIIIVKPKTTPSTSENVKTSDATETEESETEQDNETKPTDESETKQDSEPKPTEEESEEIRRREELLKELHLKMGGIFGNPDDMDPDREKNYLKLFDQLEKHISLKPVKKLLRGYDPEKGEVVDKLSLMLIELKNKMKSGFKKNRDQDQDQDQDPNQGSSSGSGGKSGQDQDPNQGSSSGDGNDKDPNQGSGSSSGGDHDPRQGSSSGGEQDPNQGSGSGSGGDHDYRKPDSGDKKKYHNYYKIFNQILLFFSEFFPLYR